MENLSLAWEIAARAPDNHPLSVAAEVFNTVPAPESYTLPFIVALLHDSVEDGYATENEIHDNFGWDIYDAILFLTRKEGQTYWEYIEAIKHGPELARKVKIADATVNLRRSVEEKDWSLARRYERVLEELGAPIDV